MPPDGALAPLLHSNSCRVENQIISVLRYLRPFRLSLILKPDLIQQEVLGAPYRDHQVLHGIYKKCMILLQLSRCLFVFFVQLTVQSVVEWLRPPLSPLPVSFPCRCRCVQCRHQWACPTGRRDFQPALLQPPSGSLRLQLRLQLLLQHRPTDRALLVLVGASEVRGLLPRGDSLGASPP